MATYKIDLDDFCEEIFHKMEEISRGYSGHECVVEAADKEKAAIIIGVELGDFIESQLQET